MLKFGVEKIGDGRGLKRGGGGNALMSAIQKRNLHATTLEYFCAFDNNDTKNFSHPCSAQKAIEKQKHTNTGPLIK